MPLFTILTLFPEAIESYLDFGIVGSAREKGLVQVRLIDFRDWARDRHRTVDDRPFGGGPGMVLKPEPIIECVEWIEERWGPQRKIALCPAGKPFEQGRARELASAERVLLLCGRYEGFDERVFDVLECETLSIGDFVLAGGELPALCVVDAVTRLVPGALGDERSALEDSFQEGGPPLDHPHWTRPRVYRGREVPDVLLEGDHEAIRQWREEQAWRRTRSNRPELARETNEQPQTETGPESDSEPNPDRGGATPLPHRRCT